MKNELENNGIILDYSFDSIIALLDLFSKRVNTFPTVVDESLPWWIKQSDSYRDNLFKFDDASKLLIFIAAYYLGECFSKQFPDNLKWATGDIDSPEMNMQVITGFKHSIEMAPITIVKNLFSRIVKDRNATKDIRIAIEKWLELI